MGALPRPGYIAKWFFSFTEVGKLVKHTDRALNGHFYTSKEVGDSKLLRTEESNRWKSTIVRAGEIVQWVRSLLCILEDFSLKPSIHTKSQAWLAVHACNPNIVGGEGRRIAGAIRKPAHLGVY